MLFRYDKVLEREIQPESEVPKGSSAGLLIMMIKSLDDWFDLDHSIFYTEGDTRVQTGWQSVYFPTGVYGDGFGPLLEKIGREWKIQTFGIADNGELVDIEFADGGKYLKEIQYSTSGIWYENLQSLYINIRFPDSESAKCMYELLKASKNDKPIVAMDWRYGDFLEKQGLAGKDKTCTFCYVRLGEDGEHTEAFKKLYGLTQEQKQYLWRVFLERKLYPPEFEWLWEILQKGTPTDWIEWTISLYQTLEALKIEFRCSGSQFELFDGSKKRMYFSTDHGAAAERVLMKVLYPLNFD